jgi:hypothetical protein
VSLAVGTTRPDEFEDPGAVGLELTTFALRGER